MLVAFLASSCPFLRLLRFFAADPVWRTAGRRGIPEWRSLWGGLVKVLGVPQLVWCGRKRRFRALPGRDSRGASQDHQRGVCLRGQALHGEERGNANDGTKTGPILECDWPATPAAWEARSEVGSQRSEVGSAFSFQLFSFSAFASPRQLWSEDFTAKLFCSVEFWRERLPKLIGSREPTSAKPE